MNVQYSCFPKSHSSFTAPPSIFVPSSEVVLGRESAVECWAKGFGPPNITFSWTRAGKEIRAPQNSQTNHTKDGLYEGLSQLVFIPELADRNTIYACVVKHETLEKPLVREFRLNITSEFLVLLIAQGVVPGVCFFSLRVFFYSYLLQKHWKREP